MIDKMQFSSGKSVQKLFQLSLFLFPFQSNIKQNKSICKLFIVIWFVLFGLAIGARKTMQYACAVIIEAGMKYQQFSNNENYQTKQGNEYAHK